MAISVGFGRGHSMKGLGIGFGLERIALFVFERPRLGLAILIAVIGLTAYGMTQVRFNDDLRNIFAGESQVFQDYATVTSDFVDPRTNW